MKKLRLFTLIIIWAALITGCGGGGGGGNPGGGEQTGTVSGTVVDFDKPTQSISNMLVQIGSKTTTTDSSGKFSIDRITPGTYWVTVSGPVQPVPADLSSDQHLAGSLNLTVVKGANNCGSIPVYNILGYGITGNEESFLSGSASSKAQDPIISGVKSLKTTVNHDPTISSSGTKRYRPYNNGYHFGAAGIDVENAFVSYIHLHWKPLAGNPDYKIYFGGIEDANRLVWDSSNPDDIANWKYPVAEPYNSSYPIARLYVGDELAINDINVITSAGNYQFLIVGYNTDGSKRELPVVTVSFGMSFQPSGLRLSGYQLSWDQIDGAKYNVKIYSDYYETQIYETPALLLQSTNTLNLPDSLDTGVDYCMKLQACTFDRAGWIAEINMKLQGFCLQQ